MRSFICSLSEEEILHICVSGDVGVGGVCVCVLVSLCGSRCQKGLLAVYVPECRYRAENAVCVWMCTQAGVFTGVYACEYKHG